MGKIMIILCFLFEKMRRRRRTKQKEKQRTKICFQFEKLSQTIEKSRNCKEEK